MCEVIISKYLDRKLKDMVDIMYEKNYFSLLESSDAYVQRIYDFIQTIPTQLSIKKCKNPKFGKYKVRYTNEPSGMQYFITFNVIDENYYIKDIFFSQNQRIRLYIRNLKTKLNFNKP